MKKDQRQDSEDSLKDEMMLESVNGGSPMREPKVKSTRTRQRPSNEGIQEDDTRNNDSKMQLKD